MQLEDHITFEERSEHCTNWDQRHVSLCFPSPIRKCQLCQQPFSCDRCIKTEEGICDHWCATCNNTIWERRKILTNERKAITAAGKVDKDHRVAYFITFTLGPEDVADEVEMIRRVGVVAKSKAYPVVAYYGCIEYTQAGRVHAHVIYCMDLKHSRTGQIMYPSASYFQKINHGSIVDKKHIADATNVENVCNYINKELGQKFGEMEKVILFYKND